MKTHFLWVQPVFAANGQRMASLIEEPLSEGQLLCSTLVFVDQVQVLQCPGEEKLPLNVQLNGGHDVDVGHIGVAATGSPTVPVEGHSQLPGSFSVLFLAGEAPEN